MSGMSSLHPQTRARPVTWKVGYTREDHGYNYNPARCYPRRMAHFNRYGKLFFSSGSANLSRALRGNGLDEESKRIAATETVAFVVCSDCITSIYLVSLVSILPAPGTLYPSNDALPSPYQVTDRASVLPGGQLT